MLGTPPAFILSQDQTLKKWYLNAFIFKHLKILSLSFSLKTRFAPFSDSIGIIVVLCLELYRENFLVFLTNLLQIVFVQSLKRNLILFF